MSQNPLNLGLRFLLELASLFAFGYWGWTQHDGALRFILVIGIPLLAAAIWGTFRVPADASANGKAPVPIPGWLRLLIEIVFFSSAVWCLLHANAMTAGRLLGGLILFHYIISYDRIGWLLKS
jgi:hypothetical protein